MIAVSIILAGAALIAVPGVVDQPRFLRGREWARAVALSLAVGSGALVVGLVLFALPTQLAALHAMGLTGICDGIRVPLSPGGPGLGWTALLAAVLVAIRAGRGGRRALLRARSARVEPWLGRHENHGDFDLVVLPTDALVAMSVPSAPPQVVISEGLVECLAPEQLDVVIEHEATHHRYGHWRYSVLAALVESGLRPLPLVGRSTEALRSSLERWADEGATGTSITRQAHIRRALASVGAPRRSPDAARRARLRDRIERVASPAGPAPGVRALAVVPALILGPAALLTVTAWSLFAHHMASLVGSCPH